MSTETTYGITGMTCRHCVTAVTEEIRALPGVTEVAIDLQPGATSQVTVTSDSSLPIDDVRAAVDEAGYALTSRTIKHRTEPEATP